MSDPRARLGYALTHEQPDIVELARLLEQVDRADEQRLALPEWAREYDEDVGPPAGENRRRANCRVGTLCGQCTAKRRDSQVTDESKLTPEILARLAEPFPDEQVSWKPQAIFKDKKTREPKRDDNGYVTALAVPYIDARDVAERLDQVVGGDWSFTWHAIDAPSIGKTTVVCGVLTVCGVTRSDAGEYKESDDMEAWKAAVSDALKRAAALFGVGRYLYRMEGDWCKYDDRRNRWAEQPRAKVQAPPPKPAAKPAAKRAPAPPAPKEGDGSHWIDDPDTRAKFWSWATGTDVAGANGTPELGLTKREVYDVLGVEHIHDYRGDVKQASHQLLAFAREHAHAIRERIARGERAERVAYASKKGGAA